MRFSEQLDLRIDLDNGDFLIEGIPAQFDIEGETYRERGAPSEVSFCELLNIQLGNLHLSRSDAALMFGEDAIQAAEKWAATMMLEEAA